MYHTHTSQIPASWVNEPTKVNGSDSDGSNGHANGNGSTNGHVANEEVPESFLQGKLVRTVYGPVPLAHALDWPVFASYDELAGCAAWMGGRLPTFEEAKSIYAHVNKQRAEAERTLGKTLPAVNAHLVNDGVRETPPSPTSEASSEDSSASEQLFLNLAGANVGFRHWHPLPVTHRGGRLAGQAELGGVWEWTSSALDRYPEFKPMSLYPLYTADFFDGKHNVVLGGSWATHPRIAGRKSFVNWYQRNYPYAWCGARMVREV